MQMMVKEIAPQVVRIDNKFLALILLCFTGVCHGQELELRLFGYYKSDGMACKS